MRQSVFFIAPLIAFGCAHSRGEPPMITDEGSTRIIASPTVPFFVTEQSVATPYLNDLSRLKLRFEVRCASNLDTCGSEAKASVVVDAVAPAFVADPAMARPMALRLVFYLEPANVALAGQYLEGRLVFDAPINLLRRLPGGGRRMMSLLGYQGWFDSDALGLFGDAIAPAADETGGARP